MSSLTLFQCPRLKASHIKISKEWNFCIEVLDVRYELDSIVLGVGMVREFSPSTWNGPSQFWDIDDLNR